MSRVAASISVSLDGFVAGPDDGPEVPMGVGGERLHDWVFGLANWRERHGLEGGENNVDAEVLEEGLRNLGAVVVGRRMFDNAGGWGDEPPFRVPVFVLTHEARNELVKGETTFTFVNEGIESAIGRARAAAGQKDVSIGGGASTIRQSIAAGLLDELQLHLVPILLGGGVRLFDDALTTGLERTRVIDSPAVTHLRFRVARP
jgi:dihydrofolate reductase